jgi:hypothetical protein
MAGRTRPTDDIRSPEIIATKPPLGPVQALPKVSPAAVITRRWATI